VPRWLTVWFGLLLVGALGFMWYAAAGDFITTALAFAGIALGSLAALSGRTWGVLLVLATGVSFLVAAALDMTDAHELFVVVFAGCAVPALALSPRLVRFDRLAASAALGVALATGAAGALAVLALANPIATELGALEAKLDRNRGHIALRYCDAPGDHSSFDVALHALGAEARYIPCDDNGPKNAWHTGYNRAMSEALEARCGLDVLADPLSVYAGCHPAHD
jgi:hypothetical protein